MHLVIIGGKSAGTINGIIKEKFDYITVTIFNNIPEFYNIVNIRSMEIDRMFIMQDAIDEETTDDTLTALNNYLGDYYPALRLITLLNKEETIERFSKAFISAQTAHILVTKLKPNMLGDIIKAQPDTIRKKYGYVPKTTDNDVIIGGVFDTIPDEIEPPSQVEGVNPNQPQAQPQGKQKKGLFSLFGGKGKNNKNNKKNPKGKQQPIIPERTYNPVIIDKPEVNPSDVVENDSDSNQEEEVNKQNVDVYGDDSYDNIDFHMFDEESDVGVGVTVPRNIPEVVQPVEEAKEDKEEDTLLVVPDVSTPSLDDIDFGAFEEKEDDENNKDSEEAFPHEEIPQYEHEQEHLKPQLIIEDDDDESDSEGTSFGDLENENRERLEKIQELKDSVFTKDIIVDIDTEVEPIVPEMTTPLEEVEESIPIFEDIDDIEKAYNSNNVKVVEKVVETVVEKVVTLEGKKKSYKNGVRTIVVTGDRKTGITRTAMNLAAFYGKTSKTLYVDFDIDRKGSLLYLGLETIAKEEDYVQSSLAHLKSVNAVSNVAYSFLSGGFDWIGAIHGVELEEKQLRNVQRILSMQKDYKTIVIDCPLDKLFYLEDIILYSEVLVCVESNLPNTLNTILGLSSAFEDEKFLPFLYNNSHYFLSKNNKKSDFKSNLDYLTDMFSLDEDALNWGQVSLIGSVNEFQDVVNKL